MVAAGVVEGWQALDAEVHLPPDDPHVTDEPVTLVRARHDRHEVKGLGQALGREEAGQEHVGVRQIELVAVGVLQRVQREMPTLLVVEDRAEDARGVEGGQAQPVYSPVGTDERRRVEVPDDTVVFDWQIPHTCLPLSDPLQQSMHVSYSGMGEGRPSPIPRCSPSQHFSFSDHAQAREYREVKGRSHTFPLTFVVSTHGPARSARRIISRYMPFLRLVRWVYFRLFYSWIMVGQRTEDNRGKDVRRSQDHLPRARDVQVRNGGRRADHHRSLPHGKSPDPGGLEARR